MKFCLCGKNSIATFLTPEEGLTGFPKNSNKYKMQAVINQRTTIQA
jgi:hypothetical protein